jgi:hypothetical protein
VKTANLNVKDPKLEHKVKDDQIVRQKSADITFASTQNNLYIA